VSKFEHHFIRFAKVMVIIATTSTGACLVLLLGAQLVFWFQYDDWNAYPVKSFIESRHGAYSVASSTAVNAGQLDANSIMGSVLELPATVLLLIVFAALVGFRMFLLKIEKARLSA
jgi:hypothetical protein